MNLKDFYPTPLFLIEKMIEDIDFGIAENIVDPKRYIIEIPGLERLEGIA